MTYHEVEKNHGVEHICDIPNFKPIKPYIHVSIIKDLNEDFKIDWDVQSCSSFSEKVGKLSKFRPGLELPISR